MASVRYDNIVVELHTRKISAHFCGWVLIKINSYSVHKFSSYILGITINEV